MKIGVCIKEVIDARLPLHVVKGKGPKSRSGDEPVRLINPADRSALEIAMHVRNSFSGSETVAVSVCDEGEDRALAYARARGVDQLERIPKDENHVGPPYTALTLASRFTAEAFDMICCGDESLDNSSGMVGPLLAEILGWPHVTSVSAVREVTPDGVVLERRLDRGYREVVEASFPLLVTFLEEAATPQYVSKRRFEEARKQPIPVREPAAEEREAPLPAWPGSEKQVPPRARVKKQFTPDAKVSATERMKMMMGDTGPAAAKASEETSIVEGDYDYLSEQLFRFLKHHEFV